MSSSASETDGGLAFDTAALPETPDLVALYAAVGWSAYTRDPERLALAVRGSLGVATCWSAGSLVGLARVVGDGVTIAYLQDVLVHPRFQRRGIGRRLVELVFAALDDVRQHVLLTDAEPGQRAFYESLGFTEAHDVRPEPLRSFVRFQG
ncbi:GNAT family N-acetyltransferase [Leifsonia sp. WHRI 6310E]|uniref:GNAT family N-acetyltransferase n=1 Tax=Leifsonia sp. WHRI 6310E TaxID=3162562 RepID=UPI0032EE60E3